MWTEKNEVVSQVLQGQRITADITIPALESALLDLLFLRPEDNVDKYEMMAKEKAIDSTEMRGFMTNDNVKELFVVISVNSLECDL
jgi:hypothetical protein